MVQQPAAGRQQARETPRVLVDALLADVLDHPDARDRIKRLGRQLPIVRHPDLDFVADPRGLGPFAPQLRLRLGQCDPKNLHSVP